jgi:hypothetical protein
MSGQTLSRRELLAAAGLGTAALVGGCAIAATPTSENAFTPVPNPSPAAPGPYQANRLILGEDARATAMPNTYTLRQLPISAFTDATFNTVCQNGELVPAGELPRDVLAAVYYPYKANVRDHRIPTPNPLGLIQGPYPVLLYAHAFRPPLTGCRVASPLNRDFAAVDAMLRHVASWGCVCVAPDLSWLPGGFAKDTQGARDAFDLRGIVLVAYYTYLAQVLNDALFAKQLDFSRVVLVGHSTGAGGATRAGSIIAGFSHPKSLSYGLIAPVPGAAGAEVSRLLVLGGTRDTLQGADPGGPSPPGGRPGRW